MATKLGRKALPNGYNASSFTYKGRPAKDQGDFGTDVGIADCACVNQFGESNNSKYYHGGVVQSTDGRWWVYLEWGRISAGKSWDPSFRGQDFMFVECSDEADARSFFSKQMNSKNTKRLVQKNVGGCTIWTAKEGDDGYIIQSLATRERGLPDAYGIKDDSGVKKGCSTKPAPKTAAIIAAPSRNFHPEEIRLASSLVGGVQTYTRALARSSGVVPTMDAILKVRDQLIPAALQRCAAVGVDVSRQVQDADLQAISKMVFAMVPREIPRGGLSEEQAVLNANTILPLQQDLDAFEAALNNEDFTEATTTGPSTVEPDKLLNANVRWLDPRNDGAEITRVLQAMTNNRHGYLSGSMRVMNIFAVTRPDRDARFLSSVETVAAKRKGAFSLRANLQPKTRPDLSAAEQTLYQDANVILTQHGTRSVNISPILQTHFRLPKSLAGVQICGANFGHGNYQATDYKKAVGYTSNSRSAWGGGSGAIAGRGAFMFLCDMIMGDAYRAPSTGSWTSPPNGKDSVFGVGGDRGHRLENDEHVVFDPSYVRIRYLVEFTL